MRDHSSDREAMVDWRVYVDRIFDEKEKALLAALRSAEDKVALARAEVQDRLAKLNELRSEVIQDRAMFVRKDVYEQKYGTIEKAISALEKDLLSSQLRYVTMEKFNADVVPLKDLRGKVVAIIAGSVAAAGVIGALAGRLFGG